MSVIPCHRGGHLCNWPIYLQDCDGRPEADAYSAAPDQLDDRQCADCGYPVGDKPVFLGGVWFCATCKTTWVTVTVRQTQSTNHWSQRGRFSN